MKKFKLYIVLALVLFISSCVTTQSKTDRGTVTPEALAAIKPVTPEQEELDNIYILLAYSTVLKNWQTETTENKRGHNIGCVVVDENDEVVFWARNCNKITQNGTQHGEVRAMLGYLNKVRTYSLKRHTIYTSLEPCAQCSGMMTLVSIYRTVYGQTDPGFGKALERLQLNSSSLPDGYEPYPRTVISNKSNSPFCEKLDNAYTEAGGSITTFLLSDKAKAIYKEAYQQLLNYKIKFSQNEEKLKRAIDFLNSVVTDEFAPIKPNI